MNTDISKKLPVIMRCALKDIDFKSIEGASDYQMVPGDRRDRSLLLSSYITQAIEKLGGTAVVEVDWEECSCFWLQPAVSEENVEYLIYVSHMLQAGLVSDPTSVISNTAYAGRAIDLAQVLLTIYSNKWNKYVAERDILILAKAVPNLSSVWFTAGIILMGNRKFAEAREVFDRCLTLDPGNPRGMKYMVIVLTQRAPKKAVHYAERMFGILSKRGDVPDIHDRTSYGFALLGAGLKSEACKQFEIVCGSVPKMTTKQWCEWGFTLPGDALKIALVSPPKIVP